MLRASLRGQASVGRRRVGSKDTEIDDVLDSCGVGGERERATGVLVSLCIAGGFRLLNYTDEVHRDLAIDGCLRE